MVVSLKEVDSQFYSGSNGGTWIDSPTWVDDGTSRISAAVTVDQSLSEFNGVDPSSCVIHQDAAISNILWSDFVARSGASQTPFFGFVLYDRNWPYDAVSTWSNLDLNPSSLQVGDGVTATATGSGPNGCIAPAPQYVTMIPPAGADPSNGSAFAGTVEDPNVPTVNFATPARYADYSSNANSYFPGRYQQFLEQAHLAVQGVLTTDAGGDLAVSVTDSPDPVEVDSNVTYNVSVHNSGPGDAYGVTVADSLPSGMTFVSSTSSQGAPCAGTVEIKCELGKLANQQSATVAIVVRAGSSLAGTNVTNRVSVSGAGQDAEPSNNEATIDTFVTVPLKVSLVDLATFGGPSGVDVVRDQLTPLPHQPIQAFTESCATTNDRVEWKDCNSGGPDGITEKNWPVAYGRGSAMVVAQARFHVGGGAVLNGAKVVGTVPSLGLRFEQSSVTQTGDELIAANLTSTGTLPSQVTYYPALQIDWTIEVNGHTIQAGSSSHPVYVLFRAPMSTPYLSLVDLTTRDATNRNTEDAVVSGVWNDFTDRSIERRDLDPTSGQVSTSTTPIEYYTPGWTVLSALNLSYYATCPSSIDLLRDGIGRCGGWGDFMQSALAVQGIDAPSVGAGDIPGFPTGPSGSQYMLIKNWTFGTPSGSGDFPYVMKLKTDMLGNVVKVKSDFEDALGVAGQGRNDPNPPGWFLVGDHALVLYGGRIYDPSYGTGPFNTIGDWARGSLDGFARVTKEKDGNYRVEAHRGL